MLQKIHLNGFATEISMCDMHPHTTNIHLNGFVTEISMYLCVAHTYIFIYSEFLKKKHTNIHTYIRTYANSIPFTASKYGDPHIHQYQW